MHSDYVIYFNIRKECKILTKKCYSDHLIHIQKSFISNLLNNFGTM